MSNEKSLKDQLARRKRINRMKSTIVMSIFLWMLISCILLVFLMVKVIRLEKEVRILANERIEATTTAAASAGEGGVSESGQVSTELTETAVPKSSVLNEDESNLAEEGDTLKVYLTFDDGPSENTDEILDILAQYGVKATFFVIGKEDEDSQAAYKRIVDEGHTLGMHSYAHKYSAIYGSLDDFESDFVQLQQYLYEVTGVESKYYRFPGSSSNQVSNIDMGEFISYLDENGIVYYDWNVSSGDATTQAYTVDEIVDNVTSDVVKYKTSVVLLHDSDAKDTTVDALAPLIEALQEMGAEILPIDENTTPIQYAIVEE